MSVPLLSSSSSTSSSSCPVLPKNCEPLTPLEWKCLQACDIKTPKFSLKGRMMAGKIVRVVDGDTLDIVVVLSSVLNKFNVRVAGIDSPEKRTKDKHEKELGITATQFVKTICENQVVLLEMQGEDKYGRLLAHIYVDEFHMRNYLANLSWEALHECRVSTPAQQNFIHLNKLMIVLNYAKPYNGGKKDLAW